VATCAGPPRFLVCAKETLCWMSLDQFSGGPTPEALSPALQKLPPVQADMAGLVDGRATVCSERVVALMLESRPVVAPVFGAGGR
jgi:hypothetical protein